MSALVFNGCALIASVAIVFWIIDRIEAAWLTISGQRDRETQFLDAVHRRVFQLPACGPDGCYCRRTCSWLVGISPDDWRAGKRA